MSRLDIVLQHQCMSYVTKLKLFKSNLAISYGSSIIGFICMLIIARALGAEEYKWIAMGLAIGNVLSHIVELGSQRIFVRDAVTKSSSFDIVTLAINSFGIRLTSFVFCVFIIIVFSALITESGIVFVGFIFASIWVLSVGLYPASWYDYTHNTKKQNIFIFIERLLTLGICLVLFLLPEYMQVTLTIALPVFIVRLILIFKQITYWLEENNHSRDFKLRLIIPAQKTEGLSYFVATAMLSNAVLTYGNQIVLGLSSFNMQLPSYSLAFQIVGLIMIFQGQALRILLREISEICKCRLHVKKNILKHSIFLVFISSVMVVIIWLATKYLLPFFLQDVKFALIHKFVLILGIWIIVAALGKVLTQYLLAFNLDKHYMKVSIIGGVVAFVLGLIFVPEYGSYAVAFILITTHLIMIISNLLNLTGYLRRHNIQ